MQTYIVVGAGILGASTAYHLAKAGAQVTLVDRQDLGQATDAAAGIICPWLTQRRNKAWYQLAKNGAKFYPSLIRTLETEGIENTGYARVGAISLHTDPEKLDKMEERANLRREEAPEIGAIKRLSAKETTQMFPPLDPKFSSLYVSGGARVNGRALKNALVKTAQRYGASLVKGSASLIYNNDQVSGVEVEGRRLEADQVIVTTGAWVKELLQPLDVHFLITPQKAQIIHLEIPQADTSHWPVVMPPNNQYILTFDHGRVVIGATHEDEMGFDTKATAGGMYEVLHKALEVAPGLKDSTFLETRVGFRPVAPDFLPVIGSLPKVKGLMLANGLGASGLTVGPYLGFELAKLALNQAVDIELTNYAVDTAIKTEEN
ncbi:NAD(P)/FAD-dependent oxidoreductase [Caldalkalibacillus mannanilyticus]|uniref:NAD(P)/FAD-dependent oxidoreductase n=1 Tax=Caldalkalibacillus mannanilyticus TaxID=1418 RepID=UPI000468C860|nr:FAD-dependent oxidoreductase [Caldalkalibacillus mannanilyticus]